MSLSHEVTEMPNVKPNIKSNIRIKSNLFIRSPESLEGGDHHEKDIAYLTRIFSKTALEELKKRAPDAELSEVQKRILNGETHIRLADIAAAPEAENVPEKSESVPETASVPEIPEIPEIPAVSAELPAKEENTVSENVPEEADMPAVSAKHEEAAPDNSARHDEGLRKITLDELLGQELGGERTAIVCGDLAEYVGTRLHAANIPHILGASSADPVNSSCARYLADILWDCRERVITKDNFTKRFTARCSAHAHRLDECYEALCGLAGSDDKLDIGALAGRIMKSGLPDEIFDVHNGNVKVFGTGNADLSGFDKVFVTENALDGVSARTLLEKRPVIVDMNGAPEIVRNGSRLLMIENGAAKIHVGSGDIDPISFIGGNVGEAIRRQAYISRSVKSGDAVKLELNGGVYDVVHGDMVIGKLTAEFSESLAGEFGGKRYFDALPKSLGGVIVTDVVSIVAERAGDKVHAQFRDRSFWFGAELCGFASET